MKTSQLATAPLKGVVREVDHMTRLVRRFVKRSPLKPGAPPGTLSPPAEKSVEAARITHIVYDLETLHETEHDSIETLPRSEDSSAIHWINIDGLNDMPIIESIGSRFGIHPLTLEDVVNTGHRPKLEVFDGYLFLVFKMLY